MRTVIAFDFDGTLTMRDTFLAFVRFSCGTGRFVLGFARHAPLLLAMKAGLYPNWEAKQRVFGHFFGGMPESRFEACCEAFCRERLPHLLRRAMLAVLEEHLHRGDVCCIVSASVDRWIRPWARTAGVSVLLCTEVEVSDGRLTGRFTTPNCYGAEKVRRLREAFPDRETYRLVAYGDSRGDRELLAYADESHLL